MSLHCLDMNQIFGICYWKSRQWKGNISAEKLSQSICVCQSYSETNQWCFWGGTVQLSANQYKTIIHDIWHNTTQQQQLFYVPLSRTTRVSRYQKKHSPTYHPDHHPIFISFFHLLWSIASSLFKLRTWQSFCTTSLHVLFGLPHGLEPSTSYSIHFFTQSVSYFCNTCPYHRNLLCCSINIISSIPSLSVNSLLGTPSFTLTLHIHLTILISACWSANQPSGHYEHNPLP